LKERKRKNIFTSDRLEGGKGKTGLGRLLPKKGGREGSFSSLGKDEKELPPLIPRERKMQCVRGGKKREPSSSCLTLQYLGEERRRGGRLLLVEYEKDKERAFSLFVLRKKGEGGGGQT